MNKENRRDKMRAYILDDEKMLVYQLIAILKSFEAVEIVGSGNEPGPALAEIIELKPDILFLDISMPGMNGFEVLDYLKKNMDELPEVIFMTAFDDYAVKAFEYAAFDYILKPLDRSRIKQSIERLKFRSDRAKRANTEKLLGSVDKLIFRNMSEYIIIEPQEIVLVKADGNYSNFTLDSGKTITITTNLGTVDKMLPSGKFFRVHRSCIINLEHLKRVKSSKGVCILGIGEEEVSCSISKDNIPRLINRISDNIH
ncbi:MAG: LytTR family DNA-binding domain-containing protein [Bacteroidales bacterium]|nr:LytTR family DNA-binding domain-containing protein [Bacteroidales bacterium]